MAQVIRDGDVSVSAVNLGARGWRILAGPGFLRGGIFRTQADMIAAMRRYAASLNPAPRPKPTAATIPPPPPPRRRAVPREEE